jgi:hypothetical protein
MPSESDRPSDAHELAKLLISRYGVQAESFAAHQALKAREQGDERRTALWHWLAGAVVEVLRTEPPEADEKPG